MKPLSIIVLVWSVIVLCVAFLFHSALYNVLYLVLFAVWGLITVLFLYMHELERVPWPWSKAVKGKD